MSGRDLRERGGAGERAEKPAPGKTWRDRLYGRLKVSVRTMDLLIYTLVGLLALALLLGALTAGR